MAMQRRSDKDVSPLRREAAEAERRSIVMELFRLTDEVGVDCWYIVESHHWFIRMVAKDYDAELEQLEREHSAELDG